MVGFHTKNIGPRDTIGALLRRRREALGCTLPTASRRTSIGKHYLLALEEGRYAMLPGLVYGKNFVKVYSAFLGLSQVPLIRAFAEEYCIATAASGHSVRPTAHRVTPPSVAITPFRVRLALATFLIALLGVYFGGEIVALVRAPELFVDHPEENFSTSAHHISVAGVVDPDATVMVNEEYIAHEEGIFSLLVDLHEGTNTVTVRAFRRHGKDTVVTRKVIRTSSEPVVRL